MPDEDDDDDEEENESNTNGAEDDWGNKLEANTAMRGSPPPRKGSKTELRIGIDSPGHDLARAEVVYGQYIGIV
jgi:hypothetical protein